MSIFRVSNQNQFLNLKSGVDITAQVSGSNNIGSADFPFDTIYAINVVSSGITGEYVHISGDTMTGTLNAPVVSGTIISGNTISIEENILPIHSGVSDLGSADFPFRAVYADDLVDTSGSSMFLKIDGSNSMTGTLNAPVVSGTIISGNTIFEDENRVITSGSNLGTSTGIFSGKNNGILEFLSVSGAGLVSVTSDTTTLTISGAIATNYTAPDTTTDYGVMLWSGTTAEGFRNSNIIVSNNGNTLNVPVLSGTIISGNTYSIIENMTPTVSGTSDLGSSDYPFDTIYADNISGTNFYVNGSLTMASGANILAEVSGASSIGTSSNPFSGTYTNTINDAVVAYMVYMEEPTGDVDGINTTYTLTNAPYNNSLHLYNNGLLLLASGVHSTTFDYIINETTIEMIEAPASGSTLIAGSYTYEG